MMGRQQEAPPALPQIDGYRVWRGRVLLHARWQGPPAVRQGRPWHVVAPSPRMLVEAVNHGRWPGP